MVVAFARADEPAPDPYIAERVEAVTGFPATPGNRVDVLRNGVEIFPAMLDAIRSAERVIEFMTFVYWKGDIARRFADALAERARAGITVRVLLDAYGAHPMDRALIERMREASCRVEWLRPLSTRPWKIESRSHRKLLICDNTVAFTGGVGIAAEWEGDARDADEWRDTHFRVQGPAVAGLRAAFADNWIEATGRLDVAPHEARPEPRDDGAPVQVIPSSDRVGWNPAALVLTVLIEQARTRIRIATPYFTPATDLLDRLCAAVDRGVELELLVPGEHIDSRLSRLAGEAVFDRLLECGAAIYRFEPSMLHQKLILVDDRAACVGSANVNGRSMRQDDEISMVLYGEAAIAQLSADFEADLERSTRIPDAAWRERPWYRRLAEWCVWRFRRHL